MRFPLSPAASIVVLRVVVAGLFIAHAAVRVANGTIPRFAGFLESKGLPYGLAQVYAITALELAGGAALALGFLVRPIALALIAMLAVGIVLIHAELGWFVGEHGTGGAEYSVALMASLLVLAATARR